MNYLNRFIQVIFLLSMFLSGIHGQPIRLQFKHLTPDDGLSSSGVRCFLKDHKGFMWIGTYYGLNRYDGYNFTIYNNNLADSNSLGHNLLYTIFEDRRNNLWIGTQQGLSRYDWHRDRFVNYMQITSSPLSAYKYNVLSITEDSLDNLWLATSQGLIYFDQKNNKAVLYTHEPQNPKSLSYYNVESVFIDSKKRIWVSTRMGLNLFQQDTKTFIHVPVTIKKSNELLNTYFTKIVEDMEGNIWFGTYGSGLYRLDSKAVGYSELISYRYNPKDNKSLSADRILSLFVDRHGDLWIGTENGGLNLFDRKNGTFWRYRSNELDPNSLNNESIYAICEDELGNFWIGTFAGGINISKYNSGAILEYKNLPGVSTSLSCNSVTCFMEDHLNRIWIGTDGGGLNMFDSKTDQIFRYNSQNTNLNSDAVLSIIEDSKHQIWLGTWGGGLNRFDLKTRSFQSFTTKNSQILDNNILSIIEDKRGNLWLGSFQNGLIQYDTQKNQFKNYTTNNSGLSMSMVNRVREISDDQLIVGTPAGLNIFNLNSRYFKNHLHNPENIHSLSSDGIHSIIVENDTSIWIGTDNGLNRFNPKTEFFERFFKEDGLPDNIIKGLVFDVTGKLWISTNKGICRWDIKNRTLKTFTKADGLQSNEFNDRSTIRLKDGRILLGGTKGFNVLYPEKIKENKSIPRIILTDFLIFNKPVGAGMLDSPLETHISETNKLTLSYTLSVFTFQYAAMDFTAPEKNQYAYIMEGFEKDWNYVGTQRMATYTNLSPGEYTFRVKGSNNDGVWNEEGTSIQITITPPFWQTWWFQGIGVLLIANLLYAGHKIRTARIRSRNRELERHVSERTAQLEAANKELEAFAYSISHDLRAPLRAIDGYTHILVEEYEKSMNEEGKRMFAVIRNEAKHMGRLIDDLLSFSHISHADMQVSKVNMEALVYSVFYELTTPESRERIDFHVATLPSAMGDLVLVREVWMNLLSNAIKFSSKRERSVIEVNYQQDGQEVIYLVRDNGAGFDKRYADKLFGVFQRLHSDKEFEGTGVGLAIVQRLIHRHGGKVWAESQLDKGTTFYFTLAK